MEILGKSALLPTNNMVKIPLCVLLFASALSTCFAYTASDSNKTISSNGSLSDTQAAVNYVAGKNQDGWVLTVGAAGGSYSWASPLNMSIPHVFTIQGASASNRPIITSTYSGGGYAINMGVTDGKTVTVKDLKFNGWSAANGCIGVNGGGVNCFRFTNLDFNGHTWTIEVSGSGGSGGKGPYGLVDNCTWLNSGGGFTPGVIVHDNPSSNPNSWHRPMTWGTIEAVYVEDCTFTTTYANPPGAAAAIDGDDGSRYVFRHNTLTNYLTQNHGADSAGPINSGLQHEVMHNVYTIPNGTGIDTLYYFRGGSLTFFDNTVNAIGNGFANFFVKLKYFRAEGGGGSIYQAVVDRFYPQDYVGTQQPGSGVISGPNQDPRYPNNPWGSVPIYCWGNHINAPVQYGEINGTCAGFAQLNRDYFKSPKPGYTEFTYPHPLRSGAPAPPSAQPSPPSNLRVISGP